MTTYTVTAEIALHEGGVGDRDLRVVAPYGYQVIAHLAIDTAIDAAAAQRVFRAWVTQGVALMPAQVDRLLGAGGSRHG